MKHSFGLTPKCYQDLELEIDPEVFSYICLGVAESLDWHVIGWEDREMELHSHNGYLATEKIVISWAPRLINISSESLRSKFWDAGANWEKIQIISRALIESCERLTPEEIENFRQMDRESKNYIPPETIPPPKEAIEFDSIALGIALLVSVLVSGIFLGFARRYAYFLGAYEGIIVFVNVIIVLLASRTRRFNAVNSLKPYLYIASGAVHLTSYISAYLFAGIEAGTFGINFAVFFRMYFESIVAVDRISFKPIIAILITGFSIVGIGYFSDLIIKMKLLKRFINNISDTALEYLFYLKDSNISKIHFMDSLEAKGWTRKLDREWAYNAIQYFFSDEKPSRK